MFRRLLATLLLAWALGFAWFAIFLPQPLGDSATDGVVVLTGGRGRIERSIEVLDRGWSGALLISGVDPEVKPGVLAAEFDIPQGQIDCCITLGYDAVDTSTNAAETALWARENGMNSLRLVTSDWHMRRAAYELEQAIGGEVEILRDAVPTQPSLGALFLEYHKLLARFVARLAGI